MGILELAGDQVEHPLQNCIACDMRRTLGCKSCLYVELNVFMSLCVSWYSTLVGLCGAFSPFYWTDESIQWFISCNEWMMTMLLRKETNGRDTSFIIRNTHTKFVLYFSICFFHINNIVIILLFFSFSGICK